MNGKHDKDADEGPTLIVVPSSIIMQWQHEIEKHADKAKLGKILRYHAGSRFPTSYSHEQILESFIEQDIILTTYSEIATSYPKDNRPKFDTAEEGEEWWRKTYTEDRGPFHRMKFKRIILDEAQAIKNFKSHISMSCRALSAVFRWICTATPVMNSLEEFYPYFRFLRMPLTGSFKEFRANYHNQRGDQVGLNRLNERLQGIMIRRTHSDQLLGAKLLNLPEASQHTVSCHFTRIERQVYEVVERRFIMVFINIAKKGNIQRQYKCGMVLLLRLRMLSGHILLIQDTIRDLLQPEDYEELRRIVSAPVPVHCTQVATISHLRRMLLNPQQLETIEPLDGVRAMVDEQDDSVKEAQNAQAGVGNSAQTDADTRFGIGGKFACKDNFPEYLKAMEEEKRKEDALASITCSYCHQLPSDPEITSCMHIYCHDCLMKMSYEASNSGKDRTSCLKCGELYTGTTARSSMEDNDDNKEAASQHQDGTPKDLEGARLIGDVKKIKKRSPNEVIASWIDKDGNMLPSTKTTAVKAQILNWLREDSTTKIIVYSQFTSMIRILKKMCIIEGWNCCEVGRLASCLLQIC